MNTMVCYETSLDSIPKTCEQCNFDGCHFYARRQRLEIDRMDCCPLVKISSMDYIIKNQERRRDMYKKAADMLAGRIAWENGFDFPDPITDDNASLIVSWERVATELQYNIIPMLRNHMKNGFQFAEKGRKRKWQKEK